MRRQRMIVVVAILLPALCSCGREWRRVKSDDGRFEVDLPVPSEVSAPRSFETPEGRITQHEVNFEVGVDPFRIPFLPTPPFLHAYREDVSRLSDPQRRRLFDEVIRKSLVGSGKSPAARLVTRGAFSDSGYSGTEVQAELDGTWMRARFFVVDDSVFTLLIFGTKGQMTGAYAERFFGSFRAVDRRGEAKGGDAPGTS